MNISSVQHRLISFDRYAEQIPLLSTVTSIINLFQKSVLQYVQPSTLSNNHYFTYLHEKTFVRCIILLVPILGNIAIKLYDRYNNYKSKNSYTEALNYYYGSETPDLPKAFELFKEAASRGHIESTYLLGLCYLQGDGTIIDYSQAFNLFTKASFAGHTKVLAYLGVCFENGFGTKQDHKQAVKLYQMGAEADDVLCLYRLAACLHQGVGIAKNEVRAADLYKRAADQDHPESTNCLGDCYEKGRGVLQNYPEALRLYRKAAQQGNSDAKYKLAVCLLNGLGTPPNQSEAAKLFEEAADAGNINAKFNLAACYYYGSGVIQDHDKAFDLLQNLEIHDLPDARYLLGLCYKNGHGTTINTSKAAEHFMRAAKKSHLNAAYEIGSCLLNGIGIQKDLKEAIAYLSRAHEAWVAEATFLLADCHERGIGLQKNLSKAALLYKSGASRNHPESIFKYATCLLDGIGISSNPREGFSMMKTLANELVHVESIYRYGLCLKTKKGTKQDLEAACCAFLKAANLGHVESMLKVGQAFLSGVGTIKNESSAAAWFKKAAEAGNIEASLLYARCAFRAVGIQPNYDEAFKYFQIVENENGNEDALFHLGLAYKDGLGVAKNEELSIKYYEKAAAKSHADAAYQLALCYLDKKIGLATYEQTQNKVKSLLEEAILGGNIEANTTLGELLLEANNDKDAFRSFEKGATAGHPKALFYLAYCYHKGIGSEKISKENALEYYKQAAAKGNIDALLALAEWYAHDSDLKPSQEYYQKAAAFGSSFAKLTLAGFYITGKAGVLDESRAINLLMEVPENDLNYHKALTTLGLIYYGKGKKTQLEDERRVFVSAAYNYFKKGSELKNTLAMVYLGELLSLDSQECQNYHYVQNLPQAYDLFVNVEKIPSNFTDNYAEKNSNTLALFHLGRSYQLGIHVSIDQKKAAEYYTRAKAAGEISAIVPLALCYFKGFGVGQDTANAIGLLNEAKIKGDEQASSILNQIIPINFGDQLAYNPFNNTKARQALPL